MQAIGMPLQGAGKTLSNNKLHGMMLALAAPGDQVPLLLAESQPLSGEP